LQPCGGSAKAAGMTASIDPFHAIAISRLAHALKAEGRSIIQMQFR
jgi:hypothetical protein